MLKYQKKSAQSMKNNLQSFVTNLDLFGQPPVIRILKQNRFTTSTGFFCSLGIATICLIYLIFLMKKLYDRQNPFVVFSEYQMTDTAPIQLTMQNFTMAITLTNLSMSSLTTLNTHFKITVKNCIRKRIIDELTGKTQITQNCTIYPTEACADKHFVTDLQKQYFSKIKLGYAQCLDYDMWKNNPPVIQGQVAGTEYQYITVQVSECQNTTNFTGCAPRENILKELKTGYYVLHMSDNLVQMKKEGYPFEEYISIQYTTMSISNSKTWIQLFKQTNIYTDLGLVLEDNVFNTSLIQSTSREQQESYNDQYIILHYIILDQRLAEYQRSYDKIQGILSTIGGLYQILFLVICALLSPVIQNFMNLQMANKLFRFENNSSVDSILENQNEQGDFQIQSPRQSASERIIDFDFRKSSSQLVRSNYSKNIDKITDPKSLAQYLKKRKQSLNLTLRDIIIMNLGCKKKEKMQIDYATDKFMSKLDVAYIISKIYEIDKLKLVLLNEDQLQLFNYLPKPVIPSVLFGDDAEKKVKEVEQNKAYKFILQDEKSDFLKLQDAFKAYVRIQNKDDFSQIDNNILQILDEEIVGLFDSLHKDQGKLDQIFSKKLNLNVQLSEPDYKISHSNVNVEFQEDQPNTLPQIKSRS